MRRNLRTSVVVALLAAPLAVQAQRNEARLVSWVSGAALGEPERVALGVTNHGGGYRGPSFLAFGEVFVGFGAVRLIASLPGPFFNQGYGVGYAAPLATYSIAPLVSTTLGGELSFGYLRQRYNYSGIVGDPTWLAGHLSVPLSLRLGSPRTVAFTPYVAPYLEAGAVPDGYQSPAGCGPVLVCDRFIYSYHYGSRSTGAALGFRLTAWRFALDAAHGDLPRMRRAGDALPMSVALSFRF